MMVQLRMHLHMTDFMREGEELPPVVQVYINSDDVRRLVDEATKLVARLRVLAGQPALLHFNLPVPRCCPRIAHVERGELLALARVRNEGADEIPDERMLTWLDAVCGKHTESLLENDDKKVVQRWLQSHPQRHLSLLDLALHRYAGKQNRVWLAEHRLHGAKAPADAAAWWLAKAQATSDETSARGRRSAGLLSCEAG